MDEDQKEIARIELNVTERLVISTNRYREKDFVDIRKFVESENYTGPTRQGIRFRVDLLPEVLEHLKKVARDFDVEMPPERPQKPVETRAPKEQEELVVLGPADDEAE